MACNILHAEIIRGRVLDLETHEPVPEVMLNYSRKMAYNGMEGVASTYMYSDSLGRFQFFSDIKGDIHIKQIGYYSKVVSYLAVSDSRKDTINVGDIYLKPSEIMMRALEVKGRARRFTVKGDTIIFNPQAFHLQDGARLEELIAKLPGVEVKNGSLTWNGKPIRLTMNGESLFGGSESITQLPVEAVENIKAYNKKTEFSERTGKDDGDEDMVLDVKIKRNFLDKWYGDLEGQYQTRKHFSADAVINRLSETQPAMITASANNLRRRHRRSMESGSLNIINGFGVEQYGAAGYQFNRKREVEGKTLKSTWSVSAGMAHDDNWQTQYSDVENFFSGQLSNYITSSNYYRRHTLNPNGEANMRWAINEKNTILFKVKAEQNRMRNTIEYKQAQYSCNPYLLIDDPLSAAYESLSTDSLVLFNHNHQHDEGIQDQLHAEAGWTYYFTKGSLALSTAVNYRDEEKDEWTRRDIDYANELTPSFSIRQMSHTPLTNLNTTAQATIRRWFGEHVLMNMSYKFGFKRNNTQQDFFTNDVTDETNSFVEHYRKMEHSIQLGATIKLNTFQLMPQLTWIALREDEDYLRARVDTSAVRYSVQWQPQLRAVYKLSKTSSLELNYNLRTQQPEMLKTIHYFDDTNPLFTHEGNEHLKDIHTNSFALNYIFIQAARQRNVNIGLTYSVSDRDIHDVLTYNPQTAAFHSRPENVRGSQQAGMRFRYEQALGDELRLQNNLELKSSQSYGVPTALENGIPKQQNRLCTFSPVDKLTLTYDHSWINCSAFVTLQLTNHQMSESTQQNATLWNNQFGVIINIKHNNFEFFTTMTEFMRRGYIAKDMNRNYFIWHAEFSYSFLKKKASIGLYLNDILNNYDNFKSQQSAYQNTYSWSDVMHHYANLTFSYHFDAKGKKK